MRTHKKLCWDKKRSFTTRLGQGKAGAAFHEIPPTDFFPDIFDVNERKMMLFKQCKEELKLSQKYLTWVDKEFKVFSSHNTALPNKELEEGT